MANKRGNELTLRPFWQLPFLNDDLWDFGKESKSGLSVSEDEAHVYAEAHLPGLKPEEVEVSFEKGVLWIRGEKKEEKEDEKKRYYRKASTSFSYQVQVPGRIDEGKEPNATFKDGVIKVTFTKAPKESQMKKIPIKSS